MAFRVLRVVLGPAPRAERTRVLLWGAGDLGEELARRLLDHPEEGIVPTGFIDDDPLKLGRRIHDLAVHGDSAVAALRLEDREVDAIVVTTPRISRQRIDALITRVGPGKVRRARMTFEEIPRSETIAEPAQALLESERAGEPRLVP
jgi:FlaA1/EpsC-like NDP-sugar epimerase